MEKKVTIIIPVYNGSNYVREAIDSALAQTYKNIEILVVNDGSTDEGATRDICLSYGDKITYYEKKNGGVSTALNLGIEKMTGEYFSWLSHDDLYYPDKIEKQMKEMEKHDKNTIIYSNVDLIDLNGKRFQTILYDHEMLTKKPDYALFRGTISGITLLIPKKAFDDCGGFDEKLRCVQDYLKWFEMLDKYKFVHMEDVLAASRVHPKQVTLTSPKMITEGDWLWSYVAEKYPKKKKIECEGSEYLFYSEMAKYLEGSPYKEATKKNYELAEKCLNEKRKELNKHNITVVVVDDKEKDSLEKTINSIKEQTFKNVTILIEGKTKLEDYKNTTNREDSLKKIKTEYYTILHAGVEASTEWLEEQILSTIISDKGVVISDYPRPLRTGANDNFCSFLLPIDGVILKKNDKVEYQTDYQLMYDTAVIEGSFVTNKKYLTNVVENYEMKEVYDYLRRVVDGGKYTSYQLATLNYDISCLYNHHSKDGNKVYMYEPCDEFRQMSFSRTFRWYKKFYDRKQSKRKRI